MPTDGPPPAPQRPAEGLEGVLLDRANDLVFGASRRGAVANVSLAALVLIGNEGASRRWWAWAWLGGLAVIYAGRLLLARRYTRRTRAAPLRWRRLAILGASAGGLGWAIGLFPIWAQSSPTDRVLIVMVISGLLPGVTATLSAIPSAFVGFVLPIWVVISVSLALGAKTTSELLAAAGSVILLPLLLGAGRTMHLEFERSTRLRFEQASLARQLERARDAALTAAGARSEFLSVMSHELRTPLNGVVGMTSLLLETAKQPEERELAQGARDSAQMLLQLIDGVLDLSKIDAGHLELELTDFSLRDELGKLRSLFELRAREKGLGLLVEVDAALPARSHGDWFRLRQVLVNLLGNAFKFTSTGSVRCTASPGSAPGRVRFEVQDTGIGLTAAQQGRIFKPFVQADASTTRRFGGTGLGLTISKRLAALMGGDLRVDSEEGVGSVFHFEIELPEGAALVAPALDPLAEVPRGKGEQVLVCDDNEINLTVAMRLLERGGYRVLRCRNGAEALTALEQTAFAVVLMDLQMPVMDGFEALRRARGPVSRVLDKTVPFVALTASASVVEREACRRAGFDAFLTKPIEPGELMRVISGFCHSAVRVSLGGLEP